MTNQNKSRLAIGLAVVGVAIPAALWATDTRVIGSDPEPPTTALDRPLVTLEPPPRDFGVTMDYDRTPDVIVTTPGTDSGLPPARVFTVVRFSIDGKLVKTRTAPPYTLTNLPTGPHILTVTGTASGGDNARIQESYVK
jgi:hypothetical protein